MSWACAEHADPEHPEVVHVYPLFGPEHVTNGAACWCHPEPDEECPTLIVHNAMH